MREHLSFVGLHMAHLALVAWLYPALDLGWLGAASGYLLAAAILVLSVPL